MKMKKFEQFTNEGNSNPSKLANKIESELINVWKIVFDKYPELQKLPVYAWGRYYKYEMPGRPFEVFNDECGLSTFGNLGLRLDIQWDLIKKIDKAHNNQPPENGLPGQPGCELWTCEWGDYSPYREDVAKAYDFDSRGGKCIVIEKINGVLEVNVYDCDSPE